jgi:hypothetical protein
MRSQRPDLMPVLALQETPRNPRDAARFANYVRAYGEFGRVAGVVIVSIYWSRSTDSGDAVLEVAWPAKPHPDTVPLSERVAGLLHESGIGTEFGRVSFTDDAVWNALVAAHADANVPLLHVSVPARFGSESMMRAADALAPLRRDGILLIAFSPAFGEAIRRSLEPANV